VEPELERLRDDDEEAFNAYYPEKAEQLRELSRIGDVLTSEACRLHEWVKREIPFESLPYETGLALLAVRSYVEEWEQIRRKM
jgi:hypothetical protein